MSRRLLWSCIAVVLLLLVGTSLIANGRLGTVAVPAWSADALAWTKAHPGVPVGVVGGLVVVFAIRGGARRRASRRAEAADPEPETFGSVLQDAMQPGGTAGRRSQVLALHRAGQSLGEIARETRLSLDAVRGVIDAE